MQHKLSLFNHLYLTYLLGFLESGSPTEQPIIPSSDIEECQNVYSGSLWSSAAPQLLKSPTHFASLTLQEQAAKSDGLSFTTHHRATSTVQTVPVSKQLLLMRSATMQAK
eukprot:365912-Chlamydomonas_euryale.AAC.5